MIDLERRKKSKNHELFEFTLEIGTFQICHFPPMISHSWGYMYPRGDMYPWDTCISRDICVPKDSHVLSWQSIPVHPSAWDSIRLYESPSDSHPPAIVADRWKTFKIDLRRYRGQFRGGLGEEISNFWVPTQNFNSQKMGCLKRSWEQFPMVAGEPQKMVTVGLCAFRLPVIFALSGRNQPKLRNRAV